MLLPSSDGLLLFFLHFYDGAIRQKCSPMDLSLRVGLGKVRRILYDEILMEENREDGQCSYTTLLLISYSE